MRVNPDAARCQAAVVKGAQKLFAAKLDLAKPSGLIGFGTSDALAGAYIKLHLNMVPSSAVALYSQLSAAVVLVSVLPLAPLPLAITPVVAFSVLALALLSTAVAYLLYFRLIADLGPARALTVTFLIPLFGALWGFLFLHEALTPNTLVGGALILSGTWFAGRAPAGRGVSAR